MVSISIDGHCTLKIQFSTLTTVKERYAGMTIFTKGKFLVKECEDFTGNGWEMHPSLPYLESHTEISSVNVNVLSRIISYNWMPPIFIVSPVTYDALVWKHRVCTSYIPLLFIHYYNHFLPSSLC